MPDFWIYSKYRDEISWVKQHHRSLYATIPVPLRKLAKYYLEERLAVTKDRVLIENKTGRAYPYVAYWFSEALGLKDKGIVRKLGLTLTYVALFVSLRDDLIDGRPVLKNGVIPSEHAHIALANWYYDKYLQIFKEIFDSSSAFWFIFADCMNQWSRYETWSFISKRGHNFNPLSLAFLQKNSLYLFATTFPTLAAIALLTDNRLEPIIKFAKNYCVSFKVADDLRDWRKDIFRPNPAGSTVICYAAKKFGRKIESNAELESLLLDEEFINSMYGTAVRYLAAAKVDARAFKSSQIEKFIEIQIEGLEEQKEFYLQRISDFHKVVSDIFSTPRLASSRSTLLVNGNH
jgi:hypothetical protein